MRTLLYNLKEKYKNKLKNHKVFNEGYQEFLKTGKTSQEAYNSLLNLYCSTNGKFINAIAHGYILNEYGLFDEKEKMFKVNSEKDIFDLLSMEYITPDKR